MRTTEERVIALAKAGCSVALNINTFEGVPRIKFSFKHGDGQYGQPGLAVAGDGEGQDGVRQLRAGLAAAEAFIGGDVLPVHLPRASRPPAHHGPDLVDVRRTENEPIARVLDEASKMEPVL